MKRSIKMFVKRRQLVRSVFVRFLHILGTPSLLKRSSSSPPPPLPFFIFSALSVIVEKTATEESAEVEGFKELLASRTTELVEEILFQFFGGNHMIFPRF